jgi:hypothetical protein
MTNKYRLQQFAKIYRQNRDEDVRHRAVSSVVFWGVFKKKASARLVGIY